MASCCKDFATPQGARERAKLPSPPSREAPNQQAFAVLHASQNARRARLTSWERLARERPRPVRLAAHRAAGDGLPAVDAHGLLDDPTRLALGVSKRPNDPQPLTLRCGRRVRGSRTAQERTKDLGVIAAASTAASTAAASATGTGAATSASARTAAARTAATTTTTTTTTATSTTATAATSTTTSTTLTPGKDLFHEPTSLIGGGERCDGKQH
jgi:hypothetical protein